MEPDCQRAGLRFADYESKYRVAGRGMCRLGVRFAAVNFFSFSVGRYEVDFASMRDRKLMSSFRFVSGGEAILVEFRPGGGTKSAAPGA